MSYQELRARRVGDRSHPFNIQPWRENFPSPVRLDDFQKQIERITGYDPDGHPRHRIVWGCDLEKARLWDRYNERWIPAYFQPNVLYKPRLKETHEYQNGLLVLPEYDLGLYGTPRFYLEFYAPPERVAGGSEAHYDADLKQQVSAQRFDEAMYVPMVEISLHDRHRSCCLWNQEQGHQCHGWYREPDAGDLEQLAAAWYEFQQQSAFEAHDPRKGLRPHQVELVHQRAHQMHRDRMDALWHNLERETESFFRDNIWKLSATPTGLQQGKYHFLGESKPA